MPCPNTATRRFPQSEQRPDGCVSRDERTFTAHVGFIRVRGPVPTRFGHLGSIISGRKRATKVMRIEIGGLFGLLILILDVWAIVNVIGSAAGNGRKVFWVVVILMLPVLGFILWLLLGPRSR